jgi:hypothetical protein
MATHAKLALVFLLAILSISGNEAARHLTETSDSTDAAPTSDAAPTTPDDATPALSAPGKTLPSIQGALPNNYPATSLVRGSPPVPKFPGLPSMPTSPKSL